MPTDPTIPTALDRLVRDGSDADVRRFLLLLQPPEVADLLEALENRPVDRNRVFQAIVGRERSEVLADMHDVAAADLLDDLPVAEAAELIGGMHSDDAVDVLQEMDEEKQEQVLEQIEQEDREELREILTYPEDSAGGIMQVELVAAKADWTAQQAVDEIRRTRDEVGELHEVFVVDDEDGLVGWLSERSLILADDDTPLHAIAVPVPITANVTMDQEDIALLVRDYDVGSVPVVDAEGRLVGRILVDDIVDVIEEEATEDIARLGGTSAEEVYEPGVVSALRARAPWLFVTFLGGIAASIIISASEDVIIKAGVLFAYIPVIMGMGGGCSTQAATVTVRSIALGKITAGNIGRVVRKELTVGVALSSLSGLLVFVVASAVNRDPQIGLIAAMAMFGTMALGTMFGVITPLVLEKIGADPAVATSPFVTTINDLLGSTLIIVSTLAVL